MVEASIGAEGASSNALGGCGFVQDAESDRTRAKLFRPRSARLSRVGQARHGGGKLDPPGTMDRPPSHAREEVVEKYLRRFFGH
jgi:hypothetical protein